MSIPSVSVEVKTVDFQCHRKTGTDIGIVSNAGYFWYDSEIVAMNVLRMVTGSREGGGY